MRHSTQPDTLLAGVEIDTDGMILPHSFMLVVATDRRGASVAEHACPRRARR